jgi:hypothetical protein
MFMIFWAGLFIFGSIVFSVVLWRMKFKSFGLALALGYSAVVFAGAVSVYTATGAEAEWHWIGAFILGMPLTLAMNLEPFLNRFLTSIGYSDGSLLSMGLNYMLLGDIQWFVAGWVLQRTFASLRGMFHPKK